MTLADITNQFIIDIQTTRWQEMISTVAQIASVWYARKNNILVYPTGIIGVLLASWVYLFIAHPPLYADGILNVYYFGMSAYGWYNWIQKTDNQEDTYPISWCTKKELQYGIAGFFIGWIVIYMMLQYLTNSNTPFLDSLVSASAVTAMWWMAKRKTENWIAWIVSNVVAIPLNFYKGFMLFTVMYVLFLILAYMGYQSWKKESITTAGKSQTRN
ncbi:MAG TPA: nicotinamide riboside transporter PnuC [Saprospiraceae bacterium]|jgi:nicotinamide mononucleotide transporter|nr:nicotinamide mononucleotide transporter [Saprospiraceae bacterium]HRO09454.1 nicotinamide riboside transporter PnuC [Saprospiraceae bacterium]HRO73815.1 nicotinamide riboside transporter PnuC [Saprospiraceae bacterium]